MIKYVGLNANLAKEAVTYLEVCEKALGKSGAWWDLYPETGFVEFGFTLGSEMDKELTKVLEYYGKDELVFRYDSESGGNYTSKQLAKAKEMFGVLLEIGLFKDAFVVTMDDYFEIECNREQSKLVEKVLEKIEKIA